MPPCGCLACIMAKSLSAAEGGGGGACIIISGGGMGGSGIWSSDGPWSGGGLPTPRRALRPAAVDGAPPGEEKDGVGTAAGAGADGV